MGIKSKEARKYIFNCLDDMMQVEKAALFLNKPLVQTHKPGHYSYYIKI